VSCVCLCAHATSRSTPIPQHKPSQQSRATTNSSFALWRGWWVAPDARVTDVGRCVPCCCEGLSSHPSSGINKLRCAFASGVGAAGSALFCANAADKTRGKGAKSANIRAAASFRLAHARDCGSPANGPPISWNLELGINDFVLQFRRFRKLQTNFALNDPENRSPLLK
jgi:hypothetical protein